MAITDGLITLDEAKSSIYGNPAPTATPNDDDLETYVTAATPVIEAITGPMVERDVTYTFNGGSAVYTLPVRFSAVESVEVDSVATTAYTADGSAGIIWFDSRTSLGIQNVAVEVTVGVAEIPENVKLACRELVRFWWQQGRQGNRPSFGNEAPSDIADTPMGFAIPNRVKQLLAPHQNLGGFA